MLSWLIVVGVGDGIVVVAVADGVCGFGFCSWWCFGVADGVCVVTIDCVVVVVAAVDVVGGDCVVVVTSGVCGVLVLLIGDVVVFVC